MLDIDLDKIDWEDVPAHVLGSMLEVAEMNSIMMPDYSGYDEDSFYIESNEEVVQSLIDAWREEQNINLMRIREEAGRAVNLYRHGIDRDLATSLNSGWE